MLALHRPGMADDGINGQFVTIPTVSLTRADGLAIVGQLGAGVTARPHRRSKRPRGRGSGGQGAAVCAEPSVGGSSVSHYDSIAFHNLLMEPAINGDLTHDVSSPHDLTLELFRDIGWFPDSDLDGVANDLDREVN